MSHDDSAVRIQPDTPDHIRSQHHSNAPSARRRAFAGHADLPSTEPGELGPPPNGESMASLSN